MIIIYNNNYFQQNGFLRLFFLFISIFFISSLFDKYTIYIDKYINKNKKINYINYNNFMNSEYIKIIS